MFFAGDEFLNTQYGNNNAYCQDNEISWLDWRDIKKNKEHFEFCKYMIAFRKEHTVLRRFSGNSKMGFPEIQVMGADENTKVLRIIFAGRNEDDTEDDIVCLAINVFWKEQEFTLPTLMEGKTWKTAADTGKRNLSSVIPGGSKIPVLKENTVKLAERSVCIFVADTGGIF